MTNFLMEGLGTVVCVAFFKRGGILPIAPPPPGYTPDVTWHKCLGRKGVDFPHPGVGPYPVTADRGLVKVNTVSLYIKL